MQSGMNTLRSISAGFSEVCFMVWECTEYTKGDWQVGGVVVLWGG